ncbi:DUF167 domain-containing protein [Candidatus Magnetomonas plexicatena]|uniref:DUF167 domain-containing protein n=1 Tax=Candidatus Magnetomonas plexicatena TaxID=2552947 RepID=UPI00110471F8|nr:DUF167 domain-containing protein [Nitrospirales bacterium LBB_01]
MSLNYIKTTNGVSFNVRVIPRSSVSEVCGVIEGSLKVKLTPAPVDGKANKELLEVLYDYFSKTIPSIKKKDIKILKGMTSKTKTIEIAGVFEL